MTNTDKFLSMDLADVFAEVYKLVEHCNNDRETREQAVLFVKLFCDKNKIDVVCDQKNNPPSLVDQGGFAMSFEQNGTIKTFTAIPTKISFEEIEKELM